jgi:hypothetical protein
MLYIKTKTYLCVSTEQLKFLGWFGSSHTLVFLQASDNLCYSHSSVLNLLYLQCKMALCNESQCFKIKELLHEGLCEC